jgi:hypothetical protein
MKAEGDVRIAGKTRPGENQVVTYSMRLLSADRNDNRPNRCELRLRQSGG